MHELSMAESVIDAVLARRGDRPVSVVRLRVGRLAGVVRGSWEFCFELASAGTPLEGATLEIDEPEGRLHCRSWGAVSTRDDLILLCACGSADVEVVSGRELELGSVEVA